MSFFRELKDFYRFHKQTSKNKKQIIFYAEHAGYYPNFEGLLVELLDHYNQPVTYITSDINDPILQTKIFDKDLDNPPAEFTSLYGNKREHRNNANIKIFIFLVIIMLRRSYSQTQLYIHNSDPLYLFYLKY